MAASPPGAIPSQRFRFEHYLPFLDKEGYPYYISPYFTHRSRQTFYTSPSIIRKALAVISGYASRFIDLFRLLRYDYIYIHRETTPLGPAFFEWIIVKLFRKKIIYDFDDAIWVPTMSEQNRKFRFARSFSKIGKTCRWAHIVTVGNQYLAEYARQFNNDVRVIPTVVNTDTVHGTLQNQDTSHPQVGWTGSFTTLVYLDELIPVLQRLQERHDFTFIVIADKDPALPLKNYQFIPWSRETETRDLLRFHIGLMPLTDTVISRGKCGFKAIQYMALGIPPVVSPVGVNAEIVTHGVNGFICSTEQEWEEALEKLLTDKELREQIGKEARQRIISTFSVEATREQFLDLFKDKTGAATHG